MPAIPRSPGPRIRLPGRAGGVRASPEAFGAGIGRAIEEFAGTPQNITVAANN